jgi:Zn ribbon nucleic-acid-binding protein
MDRNKLIRYGHPPCPVCDMGMIRIAGPSGERDKQTFECLRCGHITRPAEKNPRKQAAE